MTESHEKYLIEQIKNDPELAREYAKAQCDTKEYVEIIARLRLLVAELKEDGERLYNWTHNHYALTELENEKQDAEICADMDSHRSLMSKVDEVIGSKKCEECSGSGIVHRAYDDQLMGVTCDAEGKCPSCKGTGNEVMG